MICKKQSYNALRLVSPALIYLSVYILLAAPAWGESAGGAPIFNMSTLLGIDSYDAQSVMTRYQELKIETSVKAAAAAFTASRSSARANQLKNAQMLAHEAESLLGTIEIRENENGILAVLAAHIYLELILDSASWTKYNPMLEQAVQSIHSADVPEADILFIEAKRLFLFPPEAGGDLLEGVRLFDKLADGSELFEFSAFHAKALLAVGERDRARMILEERLSINSTDEAARGVLDHMTIEDIKPVILSIRFPGNIRTAQSIIQQALTIEPYGILTPSEATLTIQNLKEIPSITDAVMWYEYIPSSQSVNIELFIQETNDRSITMFLSSTLNAGPHSSGYIYTDEIGMPLPVLVYSDSNVFGRNWEFLGITMAVYNDILFSRESIYDKPFDISFGAAGLAIPEEYLSFYDDHRYLIPEIELRSAYAKGKFDMGYTIFPGIRANLQYGLRKDWYQAAEGTDGAMVFPDDLRHMVNAGISMRLIQQVGPGGIIPVGPGFSAGASYEYFQGFKNWGIPGFLNEAPENDMGTITYNTSIQYGIQFLDHANVGLSAGFFGGSNYYTRTLLRLGPAGPTNGSALFIRGYRTGEFEAEMAAVCHFDMGYEMISERVHAGIFTDTALIRLPDGSSWHPVNSGGLVLSALLPWELSARVEYAHGFQDITGSLSHGHDTLTMTVIRSFKL